MERSHTNSLVRRCLMIRKELLCEINPSCWACSIEPRKSNLMVLDWILSPPSNSSIDFLKNLPASPRALFGVQEKSAQIYHPLQRPCVGALSQVVADDTRFPRVSVLHRPAWRSVYPLPFLESPFLEVLFHKN